MSHPSPDVAIVGGGIIGLTSAWVLAGQGLRVHVYERDETPRQASWAGAGILSPLIPWKYPLKVQALALESQRLYPALIRQVSTASGVSVECRKIGMLLQGEGETGSALAWAVQNDVSLDAFDAADTSRKFPGLGLSEASIWMPDVQGLRSPHWLKALQAANLKIGVKIFTSTDVEAICVENASVTGLWIDGKKVSAGAVVVAAGSWSGQLVSEWSNLDIRPVKGQMMLIDAGNNAPPSIMQYGGWYLVPRADGKVLVGSSSEDVGFDTTVTDDVQADLQRAGAAIWPALAGRPCIAQWAGLRPATADELPIIGEVPGVKGLWLNTGHFRHGITTAPASARLLADRLL